MRLEPSEAYGEVDPERVMEVEASKAPKGLEVGSVVGLSNGMRATVTKVTDQAVTIDLNHELAGGLAGWLGRWAG